MVLSFDIINKTYNNNNNNKISNNYNVCFLIFMSKLLNSVMLMLFIEIGM